MRCAFTGFLLLAPFSAIAESRSNDASESPALKAIAHAIDLDTESEIYHRLVKRLDNPEPAPMKPEIKPEAPPVVLHLRKPGGLEIPESFPKKVREKTKSGSRAAMLASTSTSGNGSFQGKRSPILTREERIERQLTLYTAEQLPACKTGSSKKQKNVRTKGKLLYSKDPLMDLLVLPTRAPKESSFLSFSFHEMFGETTTVHYFSTKPGDVASSQLADNGIECLPARLIVTKEHVHVHTGENALRFYEFDTESRGGKTVKKKNKKKSKKDKKNSLKSGKLHPIVASRLDDFLKEG